MTGKSWGRAVIPPIVYFLGPPIWAAQDAVAKARQAVHRRTRRVLPLVEEAAKIAVTLAFLGPITSMMVVSAVIEDSLKRRTGTPPSPTA